MSKKEEILHKLNTEDRNYIKEKFKEKDAKIKELEHRLENTRIKYFIGFDSEFNEVVKKLDVNVILPLWMNDKHFKFYDTEDEAEKHLEELKNG